MQTTKVHPSGDLKAGKDYWVAQAAAGDTFSVTREANWEDAARATEGFLWMKAVREGTVLHLSKMHLGNHRNAFRLFFVAVRKKTVFVPPKGIRHTKNRRICRVSVVTRINYTGELSYHSSVTNTDVRKWW